MTEPENPSGAIDQSSIVTPAPAGATPATATRRRGPRRRTVILGIVAVVVVALVGGLAWFFSPQPLLPEATAALASTATVTYTDDDAGLTFTPSAGPVSSGLILYPGAKIPAAGYAPTAQAIAGHGYLVVVVPMPLNFAIFDVGAADRVIAAHPEITHWAIGGHSLGGAMAAQYAADHGTTIAALALCGAYSAADLSANGLAASSVYGSLDAAAPKIEDPATKALLPTTTVYEQIEGGNHEQCGWYTGQPNDPPATITREEQQARIVAAWVSLLAGIATP
jgi:hypothetical protein